VSIGTIAAFMTCGGRLEHGAVTATIDAGTLDCRLTGNRGAATSARLARDGALVIKNGRLARSDNGRNARIVTFRYMLPPLVLERGLAASYPTIARTTNRNYAMDSCLALFLCVN
jgi:hypothetical protein